MNNLDIEEKERELDKLLIEFRELKKEIEEKQEELLILKED